MWKVTIGRESLELPDLVIDGNPSTGDFHLTEEDCTWPAFTMRRTYAPQSEAVGGEQLLAMVPNQGTIGLGIEAHGGDAAGTALAKLELEAALTQFSYPLTLEVAGVTIGTYLADPEFPQWGALDSGNVRAAIDTATITIPINPTGA